MTSMTTTSPLSAAPAPPTPDAAISAGVDTHSHTHHAAVLDGLRRPYRAELARRCLQELTHDHPVAHRPPAGTGHHGPGLSALAEFYSYGVAVQVLEPPR